MIGFAALAFLAASAVSCIYPFEIESSEVEQKLVVDGNIYIGEVCTFNLTYLQPLGGNRNSPILMDGSSRYPSCELAVEADNGLSYEGVASQGHYSFKVDLTDAPSDVRYRLYIKNLDNDKTYHTEWQEGLKPAVIDELGYLPNKEKDFMAVTLSMHGNGSKHFRWTYDEHWEYTSDLRADYYYIPPAYISAYLYGSVVERQNGENSYYCWNKRSSRDILIFDTSDQTDDRFVDLEFIKIPRDDKRIQVLYYVNVHLEALNDDGYAYWNNVLQNSEVQDNIFAPIPSELKGNVTCDDDPDEMIYGYVNVAERVSSEMFIDNKDVHFYDNRHYVPEPVLCPQAEWYASYRSGMVPVNAVFDDTMTQIVGYTWGEKRCVDCLLEGGTKNKPDFWPNDHK